MRPGARRRRSSSRDYIVSEKDTLAGVFFHAQKEVALTITEKQKAFVEEYLVDLNATRAYKAVYKNVKKDDVAASAAARLLRNVKVAAYLAERQKALQRRTEVTQERVIGELAAIAFADVADYVQITDEDGFPMVQLTPTKDIPANKRAAIASIKQGNNGIEVKLHNKLDALDKLGRHLGLFKEHDQDAEETADDGFLEALSGKAGEVWSDEAAEAGDIPLSAVQ